MGIVLYVIASGFVFAGLLNTLHQLAQSARTTISNNAAELSGHEPDFNNQEHEFNEARSLMLRFGTPFEILSSIILCFLAGPYLVLIQSYRFWKTQQITTSVFTICLFVSVIWSFCTGVFVIEVGLLLGILST